MPSGKPNILVMWGDDIGSVEPERLSRTGLMGYRTPNIDRVANEGMLFTDYYARAELHRRPRRRFITGQGVLRTGLTKVGMPGATVGMQAEDPDDRRPLLKAQGYATGQFGKNHLGDRDEHAADRCTASTSSSATSTTSTPRKSRRTADYPDPKEFPDFKQERFGPRGVPPPRTLDGQGRPVDRGHRPADQEADGDDRRRGDRARASPSSARRPTAGVPFFVLVQHHPHALPHPRQAGKPRPGRTLAVADYHDAMIDHDKAIGGAARPRSTSSSIADDTLRHVLDRQRPALNSLAGRRHDAVPLARRTPAGKAPTACPRWCAGRARSRPASISNDIVAAPRLVADLRRDGGRADTIKEDLQGGRRRSTARSTSRTSTGSACSVT